MSKSHSHIKNSGLKRPHIRRLLKPAVLCIAIACSMNQVYGESHLLKLSAGGYRMMAEVAATSEMRDIGLMNRRSLAANRGMLFVFPEAHRHCMWMLKTQIPLSVAFVDDTGKIVNIEDMQPNTTDYHCADRPVRYALEMEHGWFKRHGIGIGVHIDGLNKAPTGR